MRCGATTPARVTGSPGLFALAQQIAGAGVTLSTALPHKSHQDITIFLIVMWIPRRTFATPRHCQLLPRPQHTFGHYHRVQSASLLLARSSAINLMVAHPSATLRFALSWPLAAEAALYQSNGADLPLSTRSHPLTVACPSA